MSEMSNVVIGVPNVVFLHVGFVTKCLVFAKNNTIASIIYFPIETKKITDMKKGENFVGKNDKSISKSLTQLSLHNYTCYPSWLKHSKGKKCLKVNVWTNINENIICFISLPGKTCEECARDAFKIHCLINNGAVVVVMLNHEHEYIQTVINVINDFVTKTFINDQQNVEYIQNYKNLDKERSINFIQNSKKVYETKTELTKKIIDMLKIENTSFYNSTVNELNEYEYFLSSQNFNQTGSSSTQVVAECKTTIYPNLNFSNIIKNDQDKAYENFMKIQNSTIRSNVKNQIKEPKTFSNRDPAQILPISAFPTIKIESVESLTEAFSKLLNDNKESISKYTVDQKQKLFNNLGQICEEKILN